MSEQRHISLRVDEQLAEDFKAVCQSLHGDKGMSKELRQHMRDVAYGDEAEARRLERRIDELKEEVNQHESKKSKQERRIKEKERIIGNYEERLGAIEDQTNNYDDALDELVNSRYDNKIARTHDDITDVARKYDKTRDEIVDDLRDMGMEITEVDA